MFVCAITSNTIELRHLFDRVFVLTLDEETLAERLRQRTTNTFGKDPAEAAGILRHNAVIGAEWRSRGGIAIDSARPLPIVVDEIVSRMR